MSHRVIRMLVLWNVVLTVLLLIALAGNAALIQAANDPPVRAYMANLDDQAGGGTSTTTNNTIDGTTPEQLLVVTTSNLSANHPHTCVVVASAQADHSGDGQYIFGISMDSANTQIGGSQRRVELRNNPGVDDDDYEEASSVYTFNDVAGSHDFRFLARKVSAGDGNMVVNASAMAVICIKKKIF